MTSLSSAPPPARFPALDSLRACLTALVVVHHAVLAYHQYGPTTPPKTLHGSSIIWAAFPVLDAAKWPGIDLLVGFNDYFFMSLMFLISGLFVQAGLERKGAGAWFRDRLLRLGLPFVLSAALLAPLAYFPTYLQTGAAPSLAGFWAQWTAIGSWPAGPVWFLWALLTFGALAALLHRLAPGWTAAPARWLEFGREHPWRFAGLVVLLGALVYLPMCYLVNPGKWLSFGPFHVQTVRVPHYLLYFMIGLTLGATRGTSGGPSLPETGTPGGPCLPGLERTVLARDGRLARRWLIWLNVAVTIFFVAVAAFIWLMVSFEKKWPTALPYFAASLGWPLSCACSSLAFCALFLRFGQQPGVAMRSLSANAFAIFLVHYPIVSWVQYVLLDLPASGAAKGMVALSASLALSWLTAAGLRRIPGLGRILG